MSSFACQGMWNLSSASTVKQARQLQRTDWGILMKLGRIPAGINSKHSTS